MRPRAIERGKLTSERGSVVIRLVEETDYPAAARFLDRIYSGGVALWRWRFAHWWRDNPSWSPLAPRAWLAEFDGRLVAFLASIVLPYRRRDGRPVTVAAASSLAVEPAMRGRGLARQIGSCFLTQEGIDVFLGTGSTDAALALWKSLGMLELRREWTDRRFLLIADAGALVGHLVRKLPLPPAGVTILEGLSRATQQVWRRTSKPSEYLIVEPIERFREEDGPALDALAGNEDIVMSLTPRNLNWFFFGSEHLRKSRTVLVARYKGTLAGYAGIVSFSLGERQALSVVDARASPARAVIVHEALMEESVRLAAGLGCPYVAVRPAGEHERAATLRRAHFRQNNQRQSYVYKLADHVGSLSFERRPSDGDVAIL